MSRYQNKVLSDDARSSSNFFSSDLILQHHLKKHLSGSALEYMHDKLEKVGEEAAIRMDALSQPYV